MYNTYNIIVMKINSSYREVYYNNIVKRIDLCERPVRGSTVLIIIYVVPRSHRQRYIIRKSTGAAVGIRPLRDTFLRLHGRLVRKKFPYII